jgi:DNA-binding LacI/PurR family transcriptional regulator
MAACFDPALTTVRQSVDDAVRQLVQALSSLLAGQRTAPIVMPAELIVRASSARPVRRGARKAGTLVR